MLNTADVGVFIKGEYVPTYIGDDFCREMEYCGSISVLWDADLIHVFA